MSTTITAISQSASTLFSRHRMVFLIGLLALVLRLSLVLILEPSPDLSGGDTPWYMYNGHELVTTGKTPGPLQTAPLYPVLVGVAQVLVPGGGSGPSAYTHAEVQAIRILQSILGAWVCVFVYTLTRHLLSERAGWLAAVVIALSPATILEAGNLTTEGLFIFLVFGGLALYVLAQRTPTSRAFAVAGICFGLAALTRAVFLLFPFGLVLHLFLTDRIHWRRLALVLLASYALTLSTWTVYNLVTWDRLVIGGEGIWGFLYQGATQKASPNELDASLNITPENADAQRTEALQAGIKDTIRQNPVGWMQHRIKELASAYLQPHNTAALKGKSIRSAAGDWVRHDHSLGGLLDLTRIQSFWPKLLLYVFHFGGLLFGTAGMWVKRREWRRLFPLYALIVYFTGIHVLLLALPRYLFPTYPAFWAFASAMIVIVWDRWKGPRYGEVLSAP
jgi:4-amino-4-deoxy-L-arabinose transferase-like glycosyltransferase